MAETGLGGAKSVIICNPKNKTKEMLLAFAEAINKLEGLYTGAEDSGCSVADVNFIGHHTPYVVGLSSRKKQRKPFSLSQPGERFRGIQAVLQMIDGSTSVEGKTVAIQGLGSVGALLADILFWHGAKLIVSDIDWEKTQALAKKVSCNCMSIERYSSQNNAMS
jgi:leucine dehydrogenase